MFFLFQFGNLISQSFPIPAEDAEWNNTVIQNDTPGPTQNTSRIEPIGDTLINSTSYSKLYTTWSSDYIQIGQCEFDLFGFSYLNRYEGAIWTDENNRVSFIPAGETGPVTLYDFSLNIGDSVLVSELLNPYYAYVLQRDSVMVGGLKRVQLTMQGMYGWEDIWIEGIGSLYGLLTPIFRFWEFTSYELTCYRENNIIKYVLNPDCTRCDIVTNIKSHDNNNEISINPNPITEQSEIVIPSNIHPDQLFFYDLSGKKVYSQSIFKNDKIFINRGDLQTGIYIIELIDVNKMKYRKQFIIL